jgi:type VI secretion system protein ImpK
MESPSATFAAPPAVLPGSPTLADLAEDAFCLLVLLRKGHEPALGPDFRERVRTFLETFEARGKAAGRSRDLVLDAKYALCACLDETILAFIPAVRESWAHRPLQLEAFGDHLAGEGFFLRLERLRQDPARALEALEVYHLCLLLGFQGRYLLEGAEKRAWLTDQLGREIHQVRGDRPFAPRSRPERRVQAPRRRIPLWAALALMAALALALYLALAWHLGSRTRELREARLVWTAP